MSEYKNPVCRGCWSLGNNCKICEKCIDTRETKQKNSPVENHFEQITKSVFPQVFNPNGISFSFPGIQKREFFAAMAMQGMLANGPGIDRIWKGSRERNPHLSAEDTTPICNDFIAERAVELADSILRELEK